MRYYNLCHDCQNLKENKMLGVKKSHRCECTINELSYRYHKYWPKEVQTEFKNFQLEIFNKYANIKVPIV